MTQGIWIEVEPSHCHKKLDQNTLVSGIRIVSEDETVCEVLMNFNHRELGFFFDHEIDHLPGMLEICGFRQGALALAHIVYGVPREFVTSMGWLEINFINYAELDTLTSIQSKLLSVSRSESRIELQLEGLMLQDDVPVLKMKGNLIGLSPGKAAKFRHRKIKSPNHLPSWMKGTDKDVSR